jgi:hypothetical protein
LPKDRTIGAGAPQAQTLCYTQVLRRDNSLI